MKKIQLLDYHTINKIAAGEVVERPSSVVKELMENSIDAGSSAITVEICNGGIDFIHVIDNGIGIEKEQIKTAFLSHATSKIEIIDDLENVVSLGFRGEALSSIAAVSQIEMITKTYESITGTKIEINGGNVINISDVGCANGTDILVKNLFYNIPARRKFLKKPSTEGSYISDIINKLALSHPEISFKYINNNSVILHTSGNNNLKTAIFHVYGKDIAKKMFEIEKNGKEYSLKGFIGKPEISRGNRSYENIFINGRYIKSSIISYAVENACKTKIMTGKFPMFVLNLNISPSLIDVNVHPRKLEVRFKNEEEIYNFIYNSITDIFKDKILIPKVEINNSKTEKPLFNDSTNNDLSNNTDKIKNKLNFSAENSDKMVLKEPTISYKKNSDISEIKILCDEKSESEKFFNDYKIIGHLFKTYWIIEQKNGMFIIDQHAAHERILFENLLNNLKNRKVISQRLLNPEVINLTSVEKDLLCNNIELFKEIGFDFEEYGNSNYILNSVPFIFENPENINFFKEIIDKFDELGKESIYDTKINVLASLACHSAVKANDKLTDEQAKELIDKLLKLENPFTCPHGRPTIIEITKYEIEKKFKRVQN